MTNVDLARLDALADWPRVAIVPFKGVSMSGDRWSVKLIDGKSPTQHAVSFVEALRIAEEMREAFPSEVHRQR